MADSPRILELRRRIQADPASIAFAQLAEECRRAGSNEEAVEICRAGLVRHPGYLSARVTLGRALIELGQLDAAKTELEIVVAGVPDNLAAIRGLAEILQRRGQMQEALGYYKRALDLARHDPDLEDTVERISQEVAPPPPPPMAVAAISIEEIFNFDKLIDQLGLPPEPPASASAAEGGYGATSPELVPESSTSAGGPELVPESSTSVAGPELVEELQTSVGGPSLDELFAEPVSAQELANETVASEGGPKLEDEFEANPAFGDFFAAPPAEPAVESPASHAPPSLDELFAEPISAAELAEELQTSVGEPLMLEPEAPLEQAAPIEQAAPFEDFFAVAPPVSEDTETSAYAAETAEGGYGVTTSELVDERQTSAGGPELANELPASEAASAYAEETAEGVEQQTSEGGSLEDFFVEAPMTAGGSASAAEGRYGATAPELVEELQTSVGEPELVEVMASGDGPLMLEQADPIEPSAPIEQAAWVEQAIKNFFAVEPPASEDDTETSAFAAEGGNGVTASAYAAETAGGGYGVTSSASAAEGRSGATAPELASETVASEGGPELASETVASVGGPELVPESSTSGGGPLSLVSEPLVALEEKGQLEDFFVEAPTTAGGSASAAEGRYGATAPELVEDLRTSVGEPELVEIMASGGGPLMLEPEAPLEPAAPLEQAVPIEQAAPIEPAAPFEDLFAVKPPTSEDDTETSAFAAEGGYNVTSPASAEGGFGATAPELVSESSPSVGGPELASETVASVGGPLSLVSEALVVLEEKGQLEDFFVEAPTTAGGSASAAEGRYGATAPELVEELQTSVGEPELVEIMASGGGPLMLEQVAPIEQAAPFEDLFAVEPPVGEADVSEPLVVLEEEAQLEGFFVEAPTTAGGPLILEPEAPIEQAAPFEDPFAVEPATSEDNTETSAFAAEGGYGVTASAYAAETADGGYGVTSSASAEGGFGATAPELVAESSPSVGGPELAGETVASGGGPELVPESSTSGGGPLSLVSDPLVVLEEEAPLEDLFVEHPPTSEGAAETPVIASVPDSVDLTLDDADSLAVMERELRELERQRAEDERRARRELVQRRRDAMVVALETWLSAIVADRERSSIVADHERPGSPW